PRKSKFEALGSPKRRVDPPAPKRPGKKAPKGKGAPEDSDVVGRVAGLEADDALARKEGAFAGQVLDRREDRRALRTDQHPLMARRPRRQLGDPGLLYRHREPAAGAHRPKHEEIADRLPHAETPDLRRRMVPGRGG